MTQPGPPQYEHLDEAFGLSEASSQSGLITL